MAANEISSGIGLRHVWVIARDDGGGYTGTPIRIEGALTMNVTIPEPRRVNARGDDVTYYTFSLAPEENPTGELRATKADVDVISLVSGVGVGGTPPDHRIALATDLQGVEPAVILWASRKAVDTQEGADDFGDQIWQCYVLLNAILVARPATMEDSAVGEWIYSVVANPSSVDENGVTFTDGLSPPGPGAEGIMTACMLMYVTDDEYDPTAAP